jgi:hypothetical protein
VLKTTTLLVAVALLGLPIAARAQPPSAGDQAYCAKLSDMYLRYVGPSPYSRRMDATPDVVGGVAVAKCHEGNAAASIGVLERLLTDAGFTLPPRG